MANVWPLQTLLAPLCANFQGKSQAPREISQICVVNLYDSNVQKPSKQGQHLA